MSNFTVLYDVCVLYPAPLRDLLMHIAVTDLYRAKWTDAIHDEWTRNVLKDRPDLKPEQLQRTRDLMNALARDCLVTGYERLIDAVTLPDPDDRHVLAAAIRAGADIIVTFNLLRTRISSSRSAWIRAPGGRLRLRSQHVDPTPRGLSPSDPSLTPSGRCSGHGPEPA